MAEQETIFSFDIPEDSPGYLLWQLTMLWQRHMKAALDQLDLTHTQFVLLATLRWLSRNGDIVTQKDLAEYAKIDKMMTSKVLRTLQKKGLITRAEHSTDTRAKTITLTDTGKQTVKTAVQVVESVDKEFFAPTEGKLHPFSQQMLTILNAHS